MAIMSNPTSQEVLDSKPWSSCPLCGELVSDRDILSCEWYYNQDGEYRYVPGWIKTNEGLSHIDVYGRPGEWCYFERDMPLPAPDSLWITFLKWIVSYNERHRRFQNT
jgi:hypothetical protein